MCLCVCVCVCEQANTANLAGLTQEDSKGCETSGDELTQDEQSTKWAGIRESRRILQATISATPQPTLPSIGLLSAALRKRAGAISSATVTPASADEMLTATAALLKAYDEDEQELHTPAVRAALETALERALPDTLQPQLQLDVMTPMRSYVQHHSRPGIKRTWTTTDDANLVALQYMSQLVETHDTAVATMNAVAPDCGGCSQDLCAESWHSLRMAKSIVSAGHTTTTPLLKMLKLFRYQNQLAVAKSASQCSMAAVFRWERGCECTLVGCARHTVLCP